MQVPYTVEQLIAFEDRLAQDFLDKRIRAPIHLSNGNEAQLIDIFDRHINEEDWVLCSWRSHYHCLLKGVPPLELYDAILKGHSIALCFKKYRILSSAIVGGTAPIAVGIAKAIRLKGEKRKVFCFIGDMTATTGIVHESMKYADNHDLPVWWVIEDNGLSVSTNTREVWGQGPSPYNEVRTSNTIRYSYKSKHPHVGVGKWVDFG